MDDDWSCEVDEGLAGWFYDVVEHIAELLVHKISDCHLMKSHIIFHYSEDDYTKCTLILEPTVNLIRFFRFFEVRVSAFGLHDPRLRHDFLKVLLPIGGPGMGDNFAE